MSEPRSILGLRLRNPTHAAFGALVTLGFHLATMPRTVGIYDAGELAVAVYELGLGHPPGQPLHVLLGFLFAHLPGLAPATGMIALSACAAAMTTFPLFALAERMVSADRSPFVSVLVLVAASVHGLLWESATRLEVYPLAVFFGCQALAHAAAARDASLANAGRESLGQLGAAGVALGLSACANPVIACIAALAVLPFVLHPSVRTARGLATLTAAGSAGLLPYMHLVVAARRDQAFVWGGLDSRAEVLHFLRGGDFGRNLGVEQGVRLSQAWELVGYFASERLFVGFLVAGLVGALVATRRGHRAFAVSTLLSFVAALAFVASNRIFRVDVPDYLGYFGVPFSLLGVTSCVACDAALGRARGGFLVPVMLVVSSLLGSPIAWERSRRDDDVPMRLAHGILDEAPRDALVVLESDHFAGPLLYAQRVERRRPDVVVVVRGLMSSGWYVELLHRQHPGLLPYAVAGAGARDGRIRRLVDANRGRAVRVEHLGLAGALGVVACSGGITLRTGADCMDAPRPELLALARIAERTWRLPAGAIEGRSELAQVSYRIGLDLYRLGFTREAYAALLLGIPPSMRRGALVPPSALIDGARLTGPEITFRRARALGDPARNAFVAATLLARAGHFESALILTRAAARDGLPEALELLERSAL